MDFVEATDELLALGVTLKDLEEPLGASYASIRAARLDPGSPSHRKPPEGWEVKLRDFARERGEAFVEFAKAVTAHRRKFGVYYPGMQERPEE